MVYLENLLPFIYRSGESSNLWTTDKQAACTAAPKLTTERIVCVSPQWQQEDAGHPPDQWAHHRSSSVSHITHSVPVAMKQPSKRAGNTRRGSAVTAATAGTLLQQNIPARGWLSHSDRTAVACCAKMEEFIRWWLSLQPKAAHGPPEPLWFDPDC